MIQFEITLKCDYPDCWKEKLAYAIADKWTSIPGTIKGIMSVKTFKGIDDWKITQPELKCYCPEHKQNINNS